MTIIDSEIINTLTLYYDGRIPGLDPNELNSEYKTSVRGGEEGEVFPQRGVTPGK